MIGENQFATTFGESMRRPGQSPVSSWSFRPISEKVNPRRPVPQPREVFIVQKNVRRVVEVRAVLEIRRVAVKNVDHL